MLGRPTICDPVFMNMCAGIVIDRIGRHRADEADVVDHRTDMREQRADLRLVCAELGERMLRPEAHQLRSLQLGELLPLGHALRHGLAIELQRVSAWGRRFPNAKGRRPCRAR